MPAPNQRDRGFSALQRAENSSICHADQPDLRRERFQCSSASRKFLNSRSVRTATQPRAVFQCSSASRKFLNRRAVVQRRPVAARFSALQRAENSSMRCGDCILPRVGRFSALQRAENSSILPPSPRLLKPWEFQCSSASRKFLNISVASTTSNGNGSFQCSSASRKFLNFFLINNRQVRTWVSVLFSEPKIPQLLLALSVLESAPRFSALQRAENSSIDPSSSRDTARRRFQCSSASRKFLNRTRVCSPRRSASRFQCSSASRKFLNLAAVVVNA